MFRFIFRMSKKSFIRVFICPWGIYKDQTSWNQVKPKLRKCNNGNKFQSKNVIETARLTSRMLHLYKIDGFFIGTYTKIHFILSLTHVYWIYTEILCLILLSIRKINLEYHIIESSSLSLDLRHGNFLRNWRGTERNVLVSSKHPSSVGK